METTELIAKLMEKSSAEIDNVLSKLLESHKIDYVHLSQLYTASLGYETHQLECEVIEGKTIACLFLDKKQSIEEIQKRAIYYLNEENSPFPAHLFDEQYNYTKEDEEKFEKQYETTYGFITSYYKK